MRCKLQISSQDRIKLTNLDSPLLATLRHAERFEVVGDLSAGDGFLIDLAPARGRQSLSVGKDGTVYVPHGQTNLRIAEHCEFVYEVTTSNMILCTVTKRSPISDTLAAYRQLPPNKAITDKSQYKLFDDLSPLGK